MTKIVTNFQVINDPLGKRVALTYSELEEGNIIKSNIRNSFIVTDESLLKSINEIEDYINKRIGG